jgi:chemotaxis regulatin CheY-phosphate phosphatase CheZ
MMTDYLKAHNQDIEKPEFDKMKKDMETLQNIEKKLVDLYTIFNNYKKINDVYPQQIQKPVTVNHIKAVITDNNILIDQYGQINNNIIDLVKTIEKYLLLTENIADVNQNPNLKMELDNLLSTKTQSGGANLQQQVKKFSPFQEQEYFTTDTFKKIIQKMEEY